MSYNSMVYTSEMLQGLVIQWKFGNTKEKTYNCNHVQKSSEYITDQNRG